jgi:hypothetical protein
MEKGGTGACRESASTESRVLNRTRSGISGVGILELYISVVAIECSIPER